MNLSNIPEQLLLEALPTRVGMNRRARYIRPEQQAAFPTPMRTNRVLLRKGLFV